MGNELKVYLFELVLKNNVKLVAEFLKDGLNPDVFKDDREINRVKLLEYAIRFSSLEMVKLLMDNCTLFNDDVETLDEPLIIIAVESGDVEKVKYVIGAGARINYDYWRPLEIAIKDDNIEMVKILLEAGAKFEKKMQNSIEFHHCLAFYAVSNNNAEMLKILVEAGATVNEPNSKVQNTLCYACCNALPDMVKLLVKYGAEYDFAIDCAIRAYSEEKKKEAIEIVEFLLSKGAKTVGWFDLSMLSKVKDSELLEVFKNYLDVLEPESVQMFFSKRLKLLVE